MTDLPIEARALFVIIMWSMVLVFFGPYLWRQTKIWLLSCPLMNHLDGCNCSACRAGVSRVVNGEWIENE